MREREKMRASDEDPFLEEYSPSEPAYPPAAFFLLAGLMPAAPAQYV